MVGDWAITPFGHRANLASYASLIAGLGTNITPAEQNDLDRIAASLDAEGEYVRLLDAHAEQVLLATGKAIGGIWVDAAGMVITPIGAADSMMAYANGQISAAELTMSLIPGSKLLKGARRATDLNTGKLTGALDTPRLSGYDNLSGAVTLRSGVPEIVAPNVHKNSLSYVGDTHVYVIRGPDGSLYKVGESAQGVRVRDGASIRAEQQARQLIKQTGDQYETQIRRNFSGKADARTYETRFIQTYERLFGQRPPGNPLDR